MWNVKVGKVDNIKEMNEFWNEVVLEDGFFKPISADEYQVKIESIPGFSYDGVGLVYDNDKLVGMAIGILSIFT